MFCPVGYTPLSMLWDQFLAARLDAAYRSAAETYAKDDFVASLVRGSPLDIAEYVFSSIMWKCWPHAVSADGTVLRVHTRFEDGVPGLFTQMAPDRSSYDAIAAEMESGNRDEINAVAGPIFEEWDFEPEETVVWKNTYPVITEAFGDLSDDQVGRLRFHTLPICFERGRFVIVETLPSWAQGVKNNRDQEILVESLGGMALCVPDTALEGWDKILSGETQILDGEVSTRRAAKSPIGRPTKLPQVIDIYRRVFPDGHTCSWKEATKKVGSALGESISPQTLRRAVALISKSDGPAD